MLVTAEVSITVYNSVHVQQRCFGMMITMREDCFRQAAVDIVAT